MVRTEPGAAEYAALAAELEFVTVPCADRDVFTAEEVTPDGLEYAARLCRMCPVIDMCRSYAEASNPKVGIWAGETYPRRKTRNGK